jgi:hypothetical protein
MLVTDPEGEGFWPSQSQQLYDALTCPKTLLRFTAAEAAGDHCEAWSRSVYFQRAYDWLDAAFGLR